MTRSALLIVLLLALTLNACSRRQPPVAKPMPPPGTTAPTTATAPPPPPVRVEEALPVPAEPVIGEDAIGNRTLDDLNRNSPFSPVFFPLDSAELDDDGRAVVTTNAAVLKKYTAWVVTVEGHCDERGTAEYNLALGERRAASVRAYLLSLGVAPERIRIVSYGKEFPFDAGHTEAAWSKNRRAQFVITSK